MNENIEELGVLQGYELDLDLAKEKEFEIIVPQDNHELKIGYFWYIAETEWGGRVDGMSVNTKTGEISYTGRSFRGILSSKIIKVDEGEDYKIVSGNLADILNELLVEYELNGLFVAPETELVIDSYQFHRYCNLYDGITQMLNEHDLNLNIKSVRYSVELSADVRNNLSDYLVYGKEDSLFFEISENRSVNHLVCLGQGDLKDRKIIHLFTDENGGVQKYHAVGSDLFDGVLEKGDLAYPGGLNRNNIPAIRSKNFIRVNPGRTYHFTNDKGYKTYLYYYDKDKNYVIAYTYINPESSFTVPDDAYYVRFCTPYYQNDLNVNYDFWCDRERPLENADYILDESEKVLLGFDEISETYDYPSAEITENYILESTMPYQWKEVYKNYYTLEDGNYKQVEADTEDVYTPVSSIPADWSTKFTKYYYLTSASKYHGAVGTTKESYSRVTKKPSTWSKTYKEYYEFYSDGVVSEYKKVSGKSTSKYKKHTRKPSDWSTNCTSYYLKKYDSKKKKSYYEQVKKTGTNSSVVPSWKKNKYYTKYTYQVAPSFSEKNRYTLKTSVIPPTFVANAYYAKSTESCAPGWRQNTYYRQVIDNFADLIENAIKRLEELQKGQRQEIDLEDVGAQIGDIVGGKDEVTGLTLSEQVTNIIVKIEDNEDVTLTYEVGG